jgi:hypothetical protein
MGNICSASMPKSTDALELIPEPQDKVVLWHFINPKWKRDKYGFLCSHGHSRWCISFTHDVFTIYDKTNDVSAKATVSETTDDGFTLMATFDYVVRQTVYATPTAIKPRTLLFTFSLKDNFVHNLHTYGWRTKVGVYEKSHLLEYCGLV